MDNQSLQLSPVHDATRVAELFGITSKVEQPEPVAGFLTFFDPGWSILRLRNAIATKGTIFYPQSWYDSQDFAKIEEQPRWRQLRMEAGKDSFGKTFAQQQSLLSEGEEIPLARVVVAGMVIHFLATKERLFADYWVRCQDKDSGGGRVIVGIFGDGGLGVDGSWGGGGDPSVGVAASRNVPEPCVLKP